MKKRQRKKNDKKLLKDWEPFYIDGIRVLLKKNDKEYIKKLHVGEYEEIFR